MRDNLLLLCGGELLLRGKLLLLSRGKLLLLSGGKLLLLLGSKLLLLLELSEVLFKGVGVKLGGQVLLGVEVGSVEHGSPGKQIGLRELPIKSVAKWVVKIRVANQVFDQIDFKEEGSQSTP